MAKKTLCFLFTLSLLMTAFPVSAFAADSYGISVGGTEIDSDNAADVFGDGTVSFIPDEETLYLNGANITGTFTDDSYIAVIIDRANTLKINVLSESTLTCKEDASATLCGIYSTNGVEVTGEKLNIILEKSPAAFGIYSNDGTVTLKNAKAYIDAAEATSTGVGLFGNAGVTVAVSDVRIFGTTTALHTNGSLDIGMGTYAMSFADATEEHAGYSYFVTIPDTPDEPGGDITPPSDGGNTEPTPFEKEEELIIKTDTDKEDVSGSTFRPLMLKATAKGRTITLTWKKVKGASGYIIYGARCGKKLKKLKTVKNAATVKKTFKKLKKGRYYKYVVIAYKTANGKKEMLAASKSVHCITDGGKKGNPTGIKLSKKSYEVNTGALMKLKPTLKKNKPVATHISKFRYESSAPDTISVNKKGRFFAKKKGTAYIYIIAQNGLYKKIKITVR